MIYIKQMGPNREAWLCIGSLTVVYREVIAIYWHENGKQVAVIVRGGRHILTVMTGFDNKQVFDEFIAPPQPKAKKKANG